MLFEIGHYLIITVGSNVAYINPTEKSFTDILTMNFNEDIEDALKPPYC